MAVARSDRATEKKRRGVREAMKSAGVMLVLFGAAIGLGAGWFWGRETAERGERDRERGTSNSTFSSAEAGSRESGDLQGGRGEDPFSSPRSSDSEEIERLRAELEELRGRLADQEEEREREASLEKNGTELDLAEVEAIRLQILDAMRSADKEAYFENVARLLKGGAKGYDFLVELLRAGMDQENSDPDLVGLVASFNERSGSMLDTLAFFGQYPEEVGSLFRYVVNQPVGDGGLHPDMFNYALHYLSNPNVALVAPETATAWIEEAMAAQDVPTAGEGVSTQLREAWFQVAPFDSLWTYQADLTDIKARYHVFDLLAVRKDERAVTEIMRLIEEGETFSPFRDGLYKNANHPILGPQIRELAIRRASTPEVAKQGYSIGVSLMSLPDPVKAQVRADILSSVEGRTPEEILGLTKLIRTMGGAGVKESLEVLARLTD